jgi:hypothetical protein
MGEDAAQNVSILDTIPGPVLKSTQKEHWRVNQMENGAVELATNQDITLELALLCIQRKPGQIDFDQEEEGCVQIVIRLDIISELARS